MSPAARELALMGAAKQREPILAKARAMREAMGLPPHPALQSPLILSRSDRLNPRHAKEADHGTPGQRPG